MTATSKIALIHAVSLIVPVLSQVLSATGNPWAVLASQALALAFSALVSHNDLASQKVQASAAAPSVRLDPPSLPSVIPAPESVVVASAA